MSCVRLKNSFQAGSVVMAFRSLYSACAFMHTWRWFKFVTASKLWKAVHCEFNELPEEDHVQLILR